MAKFTKLIKDGSGGGGDALLTLFYITDGTYTRGFTFAEGQTWAQFSNGADSNTSYACFYCVSGTVFYGCDIETSKYTGVGRTIEGVTPGNVIQKGATYSLFNSGSGGGGN